MNQDDELLDLVDINDKVIGTVWRSQTKNFQKQNSKFLRATEVLIRNKNGELWIPRRSLKKTYCARRA